jgi:NAD(P)-dependent dehydrogenase (short-subunit alcohol dehydrogenase family)
VSVKLFDLTDKAIIVTGSSRGLGRTIALGLADAGAKIVSCSRNIEKAHATADVIKKRGGTAVAIDVDITIRSECQRLIEESVARFSQINGMVCNAGIISITPADRVTEEEWDRSMSVNLKGTFNCAQLAARQMIKQGTGGSIIMTSSNGSIRGFPGLLPYCVSKGGVDQMVRSMAVEWGEYGIRVNSINPGYTDNVMDGLESDSASDEDFLRKHTPLSPRCESKELIGPAIFLASDASTYVTGVSLLVDGGYCSR